MDDALAVRGLTKRFGDFTAIDDVNLSFPRGKVHAVVGQNGAGKTTFSRLICGLYEPTAGEVLVGGTPLRVGDIRSARQQGVDMVHQNFSLPPSFTVAEAMQLFDPEAPALVGRRSMERRWRDALRHRGSTIDARRRIRDLSVEARQSLEIIRALEGEPTVLLLDEPTAVLAPSEVQGLFDQVRQLRDSGLTILIILHKLPEVFAIADTVSVLREGRVALGVTPIAEVTAEDLTQHIIGADSELPDAHRRAEDAVESATGADHSDAGGGVVLELDAVDAPASASDRSLDKVSIRVNAGEVLGVAGVEGNGQETLLDVLSGFGKASSGIIRLDGTDVTGLGVLARRRRGVRFIPSDRNSQGVSLMTSLWENIAITDLLLERRRWFSPRHRKSAAARRLDTWKVKYRRVEQRAGELSGGNVQRVILARELAEGVRLVIAGNPTRGLDLAATAFVRSGLTTLAQEGVAVVIVSADLEEIRDLSDRICVMRGGKIVATVKRDAPLAEVGAAMVGESA